MDINVPIRDLGKVDVSGLIKAIDMLDAEVWERNDLRQTTFDVHKQTKSIVLVFASGWPNMQIIRHKEWDLLSDILEPLIQKIIANNYEGAGTVIQVMIANLKAGGEISRHYDSAPHLNISHRIHAPLKTNPKVRFLIDDIRYEMKVGQAYEINNQREHEVYNDSDEDRYHLIFDYIPAKTPLKATP